MLSRVALSALCRNTRLSVQVKPQQPIRVFHQRSRLENIKLKYNNGATQQVPGARAFDVGRGVLAGASVCGLGALCFYGLGLSREVGTLEKSLMWPDYVRERVHATYAYFGGGLAVTAATVVAISRNPSVMRMIALNSWPMMIGSFIVTIASGMVVRSLPYEPGFGTKQMAWMGHSALMGAIVASCGFVAGPLLLRAACYTAGIVGGLSTIAVCAPSDKFLTMAGPLSIGLGVVIASSMATWFLPATTALGAGLYSFSLYGGLVLFSGLFLYDTQRIVHESERHPQYGVQPYDPINAAISIYMTTLNIFIRMATILSGGGRKK